MTEQELHRNYVDALQTFWDTCDCLKTPECFDLCVFCEHPDCAAADAECKAAYEVWYKKCETDIEEQR